MLDAQTTPEKLEGVFGGATVLSAVLLLGYLVFGAISTSATAILLGVAILVLSLIVSAGAWYEAGWLQLATWPATFTLLILGFIGIAIGPQIIAIGVLAFLTSIMRVI